MKIRPFTKGFACFCCLLALIFSFNWDISAQAPAVQKKYPHNCETVTAIIGDVGNQLSKLGVKNGKLTIIAGAAKDEKQQYNERRLKDIVKGWYFYAGTKNDPPILGIGRSPDEFGFLRFYFNGNLIGEIVTKKNARLCFSDGWSF